MVLSNDLGFYSMENLTVNGMVGKFMHYPMMLAFLLDWSDKVGLKSLLGYVPKVHVFS